MAVRMGWRNDRSPGAVAGMLLLTSLSGSAWLAAIEDVCSLVRNPGQSGRHLLNLSSSAFDPNVWSGRA